MNKSLPMNLGKTIHHRCKHIYAGTKIHGSCFLKILFKSLTFNEIHDNISSLIFIKGIPDSYYTGDRIQLCHLSGFLKKALAAFSPLFLLISGKIPLNKITYGIIPANTSHRIVFLYTNLYIKKQIKADISHTKSALSDHLSDKIPSIKNRIWLQYHRWLFIYFIIIKTTLRAHCIFSFFHTI